MSSLLVENISAQRTEGDSSRALKPQDKSFGLGALHTEWDSGPSWSDLPIIICTVEQKLLT